MGDCGALLDSGLRLTGTGCVGWLSVAVAGVLEELAGAVLGWGSLGVLAAGREVSRMVLAGVGVAVVKVSVVGLEGCAAALMVSWTGAAIVVPPPAGNVTVKVYVPAALGVPASSPVSVSRNPGGRVPCSSAAPAGAAALVGIW